MPLPGYIYLSSARQEHDVWTDRQLRSKIAGEQSNSLNLFFKKTCFLGLVGSRNLLVSFSAYPSDASKSRRMP